jgi:hypothetical protein
MSLKDEDAGLLKLGESPHPPRAAAEAFKTRKD